MSPGNPNRPVATRPLSNEGRTTRLPPGTLGRIANVLNAQESELSTLNVPSSVSELYYALIEYAALSCTLEDPNPLQVDSKDPFEPAHEEDESSDDDNLASSFRRMMKRDKRSCSIRGGKGTGKRKAQFPKCKFGLGETTVAWPPPPELEADHIAAERIFRMTGKRKEIEPDADEEGEEDPSAEQKNVDASQSADMDVVMEPITVQILHYTYGEPKINRMDKFVTYHEVLLATKGSTEALQRFAHEVIQWRIDKDHRDGGADKYPLYRFKTERGTHGWWEDEGLKRARPSDSVVLADGQLEAIMKDVEKFLASSTKRWYVKHGLPHRRSFLFYGPPGTGKTSTIRAIASAFRLSCCFLSMTDANFSNQMLGDALGQIPPNALLVLEDVDALFNMDRKSEGSPSLTFSGLLNALDGVISVDGVITIMTTNHLERLDRALVRGGRVDRRFYFGHPNITQLIDLFKVFYPQAEAALAKKFAHKVMDRPEGEEVRSIATLQQLFIHAREEPADECVEAMDEFFKFHFPGELSGALEGLYM